MTQCSKFETSGRAVQWPYSWKNITIIFSYPPSAKNEVLSPCTSSCTIGLGLSVALSSIVRIHVLVQRNHNWAKCYQILTTPHKIILYGASSGQHIFKCNKGAFINTLVGGLGKMEEGPKSFGLPEGGGPKSIKYMLNSFVKKKNKQTKQKRKERKKENISSE